MSGEKDESTKQRDARDHLKDPYPHRTPEELKEDAETKRQDEFFKKFGTEGTHP